MEVCALTDKMRFGKMLMRYLKKRGEGRKTMNQHMHVRTPPIPSDLFMAILTAMIASSVFVLAMFKTATTLYRRADHLWHLAWKSELRLPLIVALIAIISLAMAAPHVRTFVRGNWYRYGDPVMRFNVFWEGGWKLRDGTPNLPGITLPVAMRWKRQYPVTHTDPSVPSTLATAFSRWTVQRDPRHTALYVKVFLDGELITSMPIQDALTVFEEMTSDPPGEIASRINFGTARHRVSRRKNPA